MIVLFGVVFYRSGRAIRVVTCCLFPLRGKLGRFRAVAPGPRWFCFRGAGLRPRAVAHEKSVGYSPSD